MSVLVKLPLQQLLLFPKDESVRNLPCSQKVGFTFQLSVAVGVNVRDDHAAD